MTKSLEDKTVSVWSSTLLPLKLKLKPRKQFGKSKADVRFCGPANPLGFVPLRFPWESHNRSQGCLLMVHRANKDANCSRTFGILKWLKSTITVASADFLNHSDNCSRVGVSLGWMWTVTNTQRPWGQKVLKRCRGEFNVEPALAQWPRVNHLLLIYSMGPQSVYVILSTAHCASMYSNLNCSKYVVQDLLRVGKNPKKSNAIKRLQLTVN